MHLQTVLPPPSLLQWLTGGPTGGGGGCRLSCQEPDHQPPWACRSQQPSPAHAGPWMGLLFGEKHLQESHPVRNSVALPFTSPHEPHQGLRTKTHSPPTSRGAAAVGGMASGASCACPSRLTNEDRNTSFWKRSRHSLWPS